MNSFQALILGLVQGLTEYLPVSSSGHLVLLQKIFGLKENVLLFDILVHLGTLVPLLIIFRDEILAIIKKPWGRLPLLIIAGTVPTALIGLGFKDFFERLFVSGSTLGIEFIITGLILWLAERQKSGRKNLEKTTFLDAIFVGVAQGLAILPAISRSGLTISGALIRGLNREWAAKFSFLLSIPAILGAAVLDLKSFVEQNANLAGIDLMPFIVGFFAAMLSGYFAVKFMLEILRKGKLTWFSYYVWILGVTILVLQAAGKF
ncbi:undecaprenyl-diphosphate phosphatase [Carboxydothermus hydrogenoformans]|uniref:Undecaprenyl-diphosphatase n=1 Tax=Carboxydothermus hydrogenoformans (strain ATCC BAA-161 / DSM 6008 / Z-2901) TaxID=246194 RepID=UPPP_CARHZ|nr:undecaprenyl-diphosphate phosphatase [Carboxydothermus hydrogenoformans]Q3ACY1.1 RecName: Full=Undecaprenyl-diphosphatase; AltName: Full=Bacitracin resistance protein; AltName: Full=Undecaprenyl pyrophosphate phosphatase [Carboxydothermus hydrogenoformans Z-2901]ABB16228.1 putative undecaprenol kinase [Carboxydothermus hydrogenoformans Z-2901]